MATVGRGSVLARANGRATLGPARANESTPGPSVPAKSNGSAPGLSVLARSMVPKMPEHRRACERATEAPETRANGWEANENGSGRSTWRSDGDWGGRGWRSCSRG